MALIVTGVNSGFVTVRPTDAPSSVDDTEQVNGYAFAQKDTTPSGAVFITEIGAYVSNNGSFTGGPYRAYIWDDNAGTPGNVIAGPISGNSTTTNTSGWQYYTGLSIAVNVATVYWIGFDHDITVGRCDLSFKSQVGTLVRYHATGVKPSIALTNFIGAIYAITVSNAIGLQNTEVRSGAGGMFQ